MESPKQSYIKLKNIDNIKQLASDTIFTKYIIKNLKGVDKLQEIDSTDQESLIRNLNGGYPLPGCIYTFIYPIQKDPNKILLKNKEIEFIDYVPILFCTSIQKDSFKGINLNMLPPLERVNFFETYFNLYKDFFKDIEEITENNKLALNERYIKLASGGKAQELIKILSDISKSNFNYGFRSYNFNKIKQLRMIEYVEWSYIPHYEPSNAFKLINQKQIHDLYYKSL